MGPSIQIAINDSAVTVNCKHRYHRRDRKEDGGRRGPAAGTEIPRAPPLARRVELLLCTVSRIDAMKKTAEWPFTRQAARGRGAL
ncbi:hypothetical protein [Burkholderia ambifaria]|uniref:hypothetical protein n=1 Tax=Burkholderia ambifaria TaxID=152480 RepID=UPI0012FE21CB|nr:hypothetical protein [Burkholderia ambifaria]